ncbi:MAG: ABC transporter ATP-binding protein, partial [Erysipelothrix sp.]|nr:ABC transporter ATP-binding protein [Erysipelothrix sp.]
SKIMIIAVLIHNPNIWLLDEPLTGLDPKSSFKLKELMREHAHKGNTVLFSTHVLEVAEKLCDEIAIIDHGEIKYQGTLNALKEQHPEKSLEEIFLEVTK